MSSRRFVRSGDTVRCQARCNEEMITLAAAATLDPAHHTALQLGAVHYLHPSKYIMEGNRNQCVKCTNTLHLYSLSFCVAHPKSCISCKIRNNTFTVPFNAMQSFRMMHSCRYCWCWELYFASDSKWFTIFFLQMLFLFPFCRSGNSKKQYLI